MDEVANFASGIIGLENSIAMPALVYQAQAPERNRVRSLSFCLVETELCVQKP